MRNTLANVVALVNQATRAARAARQTLSVLKSRIGALAKTHGRLTETNWGPTSLGRPIAAGIERSLRDRRRDLGG